MNNTLSRFEDYGSFHEDDVVKFEGDSKNCELHIERTSGEDKIEDRSVIRRATITIQKIKEIELNAPKINVTYEQLLSAKDMYWDIVDIVVDSPNSIAIYFEAILDGKWYPDVKLALQADHIALQFRDEAGTATTQFSD